MDIVDALEQTYGHTAALLANVSPEGLDATTPCEGWTVRDLLAHTIAVVHGLGAAASGATAPPFELGEDPAAQFAITAEANLAAWRADGVMDRIVNGGPGPMPGRALAGINLLDTATHAWDLAVATGQASDLPPGVAEAALEASRQIISPEIRPGRFAPEVEATPGASPTEQLAAFLGRHP